MEGLPKSNDIYKHESLGRNTSWEGDGYDKKPILNQIKYTLEDMGRSLEGAKVLELGSGSGGLLQYLEKEGVDCVGVDIRPRGGSDVSQVQARVESLPFSDESFDMVLSVQVFDPNVYKQDQGLMLAEISRVLKTDGLYYGALEDLNVKLPDGLEYIKSDSFVRIIRKK